jgi:signal transduction histidine kinase/ligand-binding sensor domain-containing protein/CheY-like chemotaxis protein/AraC-like DNA-binding protein
MVCASTLSRGSGNFFFDHYSTGQGLSHKTVTDIIRTRDGFLWVGTTNGLNRFDGYTIKVFHLDDAGQQGSGSNIVHGMAENTLGQLFVATNNGVKYYDPAKDTFVPLMIDGGSGGQISCITADDKGGLWVSRSGVGLYRILRQGDGYAANYFPIPQRYREMGLFDAWRILYQDGALWSVSGFGLLRHDISTGDVAKVDIGMEMPYCSSIQSGRPGEIIVTASLRGIMTVSTASLKLQWTGYSSFSPTPKGVGYLQDAVLMPSGEMYICASPGMFRQAAGSSEVISISHLMPELLQIDVCSVMYYDREGILWVGTQNYGFYALKSNERSFGSLSLFDSRDFSHSLITSMAVLSNEDIVYGGTQGLYFYTARNSGQKAIRKVSDRPVVSIQASAKDEVYLFTHDSLVQFYPRTGALRNLKPISTVFSASLQDSILWYSRWSFGLLGYNLRSGKKYQTIIDSAELSRNTVFCITIDKDDRSLWLGTYGAGMVHVEQPASDNPKLTKYVKSLTGNSISQNEILSIHDDGAGKLWIATSGSGVNVFDKSTQDFAYITTKDGLYSNVVESINSDANGDIWMASSILNKYNRQSGTITRYTATDGVIDEFNVGVTARLPNGQLYFGGNGIMKFHPDSILPRQIPVLPVITALRILGQEVRVGDTVQGRVMLSRSITLCDSLRLPYWAHHFSIDFSSLQLRYSDNISYSYMLQGFDRSWIPSPTSVRSATYTGLEPGSYTFMVRAANDRGEWSEIRTLKLEIVPAWWNTLLFKLAVLLAAALWAALYVRRRIKLVRLRTARLESTIALRTAELKKANESLLKQADALNEQNESLRENQLFIELKNSELIETLHLKDKLMGIIGHDFKNSFTSLQNSAVLLNSPEILAQPDKTKTYASYILTASQSILQQMMMVFDWATGQMDHLRYNPIEINPEILIDDTLSLLRASASEKHIAMTAQYEFASNLYVDPRMISTVMRNLLTNAIKFTPIGGKIHVMVQEYESSIDITVIDTGIGISAATQAAIFSRLERENIAVGTAGEKGSGLGLMICRNFVEKNNGTITLSSTEGEGSVFTLTLPKGELPAVRKKQLAVSTSAEEEIGISGHYVAVIIDDDPMILETIHQVFSPNFTVIKARDGQEGLYLARNMMPDIIISDINIPGMSGLDICKIFKSDPLTSHIPFILITAENKDTVEQDAYLCGANDLVAKPFNPYILRQKLRTLLRDRDLYGIKKHIPEQAQAAFPMPEDYENKIIGKVITLVQERMSDPAFDINSVADHVSMSRTQLWRIFKSTTGKSLGDYIKDMRMQKASEMLKTGRYRVSEVAYEIGFSDPKYFAKGLDVNKTAFGEKH